MRVIDRCLSYPDMEYMTLLAELRLPLGGFEILVTVTWACQTKKRKKNLVSDDQKRNATHTTKPLRTHTNTHYTDVYQNLTFCLFVFTK